VALIFTDSSAVVKRYVQESGSAWVSGLFTAAPPNRVAIVSITGVDAIISQLDTLRLDELLRLQDAIQQRLKLLLEAEKSQEEKEDALDHALLAAGLITRISVPRDPSKAERRRITVIGEPVSETIMQERRQRINKMTISLETKFVCDRELQKGTSYLAKI